MSLSVVTPGYPAQIDALSASGTGLIDAAADAMGSAVPSCPGWDVAQVVAHVAHIYDWANRNLTAPPEERVRMGRPPADGAARCADALGALVWTLRTRDPQTVCAGPFQPRTAGWWARRQLLETVVHRWDVEKATGTPTAIDTGVAATGVAEFLEVFAPLADSPGPVVLRAADLALTWTAVPAAAADPVTLTGSSDQLLLLLWGRVELDAVRVEGDPGTYRSWRGSIAT